MAEKLRPMQSSENAPSQKAVMKNRDGLKPWLSKTENSNRNRYSQGPADAILHDVLDTTRFTQGWCQHVWQKSACSITWTSGLVFESGTIKKQIFLNRIVIRNKNWIHYYEPESKYQSLQCKYPAFSSSK
jgi:hypothetical protein